MEYHCIGCREYVAVSVGCVPENALGESRGVEWLVVGHFVPAVVEVVFVYSGYWLEQMAVAPFQFFIAVLVSHYVVIAEWRSAVGEFYLSLPQAVAGHFQFERIGMVAATELSYVGAHIERFAPVRTVFYMEYKFHGRIYTV